MPLNLRYDSERNGTTRRVPQMLVLLCHAVVSTAAQSAFKSRLSCSFTNNRAIHIEQAVHLRSCSFCEEDEGQVDLTRMKRAPCGSPGLWRVGSGRVRRISKSRGSGRVGSGQEDFKFPRVGTGRVRSFRKSRGSGWVGTSRVKTSRNSCGSGRVGSGRVKTSRNSHGIS